MLKDVKVIQMFLLLTLFWITIFVLFLLFDYCFIFSVFVCFLCLCVRPYMCVLACIARLWTNSRWKKIPWNKWYSSDHYLSLEDQLSELTKSRTLLSGNNSTLKEWLNFTKKAMMYEVLLSRVGDMHTVSQIKNKKDNT